MSSSFNRVSIHNYCPFPLYVSLAPDGDETLHGVWSQGIQLIDPGKLKVDSRKITVQVGSPLGVKAETVFSFDSSAGDGVLEIHQVDDTNFEFRLYPEQEQKLSGAAFPVPNLGQGFDTITDTIKPQALIDTATSVTGGTGSRFDFFVEYDYRELRNKLDVKTHVSGQSMVTKVDLSVDVSTELHTEETTVMLVHRVKVVTKVVSLKSHKKSARAEEMMGKSHAEIFTNLGNAVITDLEHGGEMVLMAIFKSQTREQSVKVKSKLESKTEIFASKVNFDAAVESLRSEVNRHISYSVVAKWNGGEVKRYDTLVNPATALLAINEWQASLADKAAIVGFSFKDLVEVDASFSPIGKSVQKFQQTAINLKELRKKLDTTIQMARQYQKARTDLRLPTTTAANEISKEAEALLVQVNEELVRLDQSVISGSFTPTPQLAEKAIACVRRTPVFSYQTLDRGDWGGYGGSGMSLHTMAAKDVKYITEINMYGGEYGMNGMTFRYKDFSDKDCEVKLGPNGQGGHQQVTATFNNEVLGGMWYWGKFRDRWMAVGGITLHNSKGVRFGPCGYSLPNPESTWAGVPMTTGNEKYIVGVWVRAEGWIQQIGPYYRQCYTTYPYEQE